MKMYRVDIYDKRTGNLFDGPNQLILNHMNLKDSFAIYSSPDIEFVRKAIYDIVKECKNERIIEYRKRSNHI